jgi:histidinol-phosphate/aromatic aminotransferase/cobyric acid decarboxylase-like protein
MSQGLVVRKFASPGPLANYLRFTVRSAPAQQRLLDSLERYVT